jgi:hypothetical protein
MFPFFIGEAFPKGRGARGDLGVFTITAYIF